MERNGPTQLVLNHDVGVQVQGDLFQRVLRHETGLLHDVADGNRSEDLILTCVQFGL